MTEQLTDMAIIAGFVVVMFVGVLALAYAESYVHRMIWGE